MDKYLNLLRLFFIKPYWAFNIIWYSKYNPFGLSKFHHNKTTHYKNAEISYKDLYKFFAIKDDYLKSLYDEISEIKFDTKIYITKIPDFYDASNEFASLCYIMVRIKKPSIIVETGVGRGVTSFYILKALEKNNKGQLYSIDLPVLSKKAERDIGVLIPDNLKARWHLTLGPGTQVMRKLKNKYGTIDIFVHDSNHYYLNQLAEYKIAINWLSDDGVLISDDISNDSLIDVNKNYSYKILTIKQSKPSYIGMLLKNQR